MELMWSRKSWPVRNCIWYKKSPKRNEGDSELPDCPRGNGWNTLRWEHHGCGNGSLYKSPAFRKSQQFQPWICKRLAIYHVLYWVRRKPQLMGEHVQRESIFKHSHSIGPFKTSMHRRRYVQTSKVYQAWRMLYVHLYKALWFWT